MSSDTLQNLGALAMILIAGLVGVIGSIIVDDDIWRPKSKPPCPPE